MPQNIGYLGITHVFEGNSWNVAYSKSEEPPQWGLRLPSAQGNMRLPLNARWEGLGEPVQSWTSTLGARAVVTIGSGSFLSEPWIPPRSLANTSVGRD